MLGVVRILEEIESFGPSGAGRLSFGRHGAILVQGRSVCWAVASGVPHRLTDRLRRMRNPPLTRAQLESVFDQCKRDRVPVGEALVSGGLVSADALRHALLQHAAEAIARLGEVGAVQTDFTAHSPVPYDGRFAFTTPEILAGVGTHLDSLNAAMARSVLSRELFADSDGFAFVRSPSGADPLVLAVRGCRGKRVSELLDAAEWVADRARSSRRGRASTTAEEADSGGRIVVIRKGDIRYVFLNVDATVARRRAVSRAQNLL